MQGLKRALFHPVVMLILSEGCAMFGLFAYFVSGLIIFLVFAVAAGFLIAAHIERIVASERKLVGRREQQ